MSYDSSDINGDKRLHPDNKLSVRRITSIINSYRVVDIAFLVFIAIMTFYYLTIISVFSVPIGDGSVFMINARQWLNDTELTEIYRPPLFSWIIDAIWIFMDENWIIIKYVQMVFTVASIVLLYLLLRRRKGSLFAFGVSVLTLTNVQLFFYTSQMLTEGISLFFLILTLYFLEGTKKTYWLLAGISVGLTFAARYPILLQALILFVVKSVSKRNLRSTTIGALGITCVILLVVIIMYSKTGTFQMALKKDSTFANSISSFYVLNALHIWGPTILLLPIAFMFKSTYKDKFHYIFISWFVVSLLSWSTNVSNHQFRFMIQFMPSVYFLVILAVENLVKFERQNLIFLKSKNNNNLR